MPIPKLTVDTVERVFASELGRLTPVQRDRQFTQEEINFFRNDFDQDYEDDIEAIRLLMVVAAAERPKTDVYGLNVSKLYDKAVRA